MTGRDVSGDREYGHENAEYFAGSGFREISRI